MLSSTLFAYPATQGVLCSRMGEYERAMGHLQLLLRSFDKQEAASTRCGDSSHGRVALVRDRGLYWTFLSEYTSGGK